MQDFSDSMLLDLARLSAHFAAGQHELAYHKAVSAIPSWLSTSKARFSMAAYSNRPAPRIC